MKRLFTLPAFLVIAWYSIAQYHQTMSYNDVSELIYSDGTFFLDKSNNIATYQVPKTGTAKAIYFMNAVAVGRDVNGQIKGAVSDYTHSDFFPGPIATNYTDPTYVSAYAHSIWVVNKYEIVNHITNWNTPGYVTPASILSWPGNGNTANGEAAMLAPFVDLNNDQVYDPQNGDYPLIRGDQAFYCIMNDSKALHPSGSSPVGMELHLMFYQYATNDALNYVTFLQSTLINRGTQTLSNLRFGSFVDFDLGNYNDDYIGTAPDHNLAYVYNGDLSDENASGLTGYGNLPPAVGVMTLNAPLYSHVALDSLPVTATATAYENVLSGLALDGATINDDNGQATPYSYYGDPAGWNESTAGNPPGDRKSILGFAPQNFAPGAILCYDYAIIYARSSGGQLFDCVDSLGQVADFVQNFYDTQGFPCEQQILGTPEAQQPVVTVSPNPSATILTVSGIDHGSFRIVGLDGKVLQSGTLNGQPIDIQSLNSGYYLLIVGQNGTGQHIPFIKQ